MANKVTQKDMFNKVLAAEGIRGDEELTAFIQKQIDKLDAKSANRKQTANQVENESLKAVIKEVLAAAGKGMTATEIFKADEALAATSNQRVSALLKQLQNAGEVSRTMDKKKAYFSLV